jgi:hypothetical protein
MPSKLELNIRKRFKKYQEKAQSKVIQLPDELKQSPNIDWYHVSQHYKLSEQFLDDFQNYLYWPYISRYQRLSDKFIKQFINYIDADEILKNKKVKLTEELKILFKLQKL